MNIRDIGIYFTFARPGNGKSLDQARILKSLLRGYRRTEKKYPGLPQRYVISNQKFSLKVEQESLNHLFYWESIRQLRYCPRQVCFKGVKQHPVHDCDILIDEIANYFPSDGYKDTPKWFRKLFAQHRHRGLEYLRTHKITKAWI